MTTPPKIQRLTDTITDLRPNWHPERITRSLINASLTRTHPQLVTDAIHAALDPDVRNPEAIPLHHASFSGDKCPRCAAKDAPPAIPHVVKCGKCGRQKEPGIDHTCVPVGRPTKTEDARAADALNREYIPRITLAIKRGDHDEKRRLKAELKTQLDAIWPGVA